MVLPEEAASQVLAFFLVYSWEVASEVHHHIYAVASSEVATGVTEVAVEMVEIQESAQVAVQDSTDLYYPAHHQKVFASVGHDYTPVGSPVGVD